MKTRVSANSLRMFGSRFAAASVVMIGLWQASLYLAAVVESHEKRVVMNAALERAVHGLSGSISGYVSDLMILARNGRLRALAAGDAAGWKAATADFEAFVSEKPHVAQLRFIDGSGQEVVRVDRWGGEAVVVGPQAMQNKADRYYFRNTIDLDVGAIYASPVDLNVEHGAIELPWRPMFRIATPIEPAGPESRGIVVINIDASELLNEVSQAQPGKAAPIQLVNADGYWLAGVAIDKLWGFMFGRDTSLAVEDPQAWARFSQGDLGEFVSQGRHYVFRGFRPGAVLADVAAGEVVASGDGNWTLFAETPGASLLSAWRWYHLPFVIVGLAITATIAAGWTQMVNARRNSENEARRAEEEVMRQERLASLGSLVAGVAHELNSPIGSAVTIASTMARDADAFARAVEAGPVRRSQMTGFVNDMRTGSDMVQRNLERADSLIRHFKQVAVDQTSERLREFRLQDLIDDILSSNAHQLRDTRVKIVSDIRTHGTLSTYPGPLAQVLFNLINNARIHAFSPDQEGVISIAARDDGEEAIEITVADNGAGIAPEHLDSIFNPFFTTKLGAGGSGLGLSIVLNIVENVLGGSIEADSTPGAGTSMAIRMPRSVLPADDTGKERPHHADELAA